jgi:hypothetical protein
VDVRKWVALLSTLCGMALGAGIPLLALTSVPRTEIAEGAVVWVHPADHELLIHDTGGDGGLRGRDVLVRLPYRHRRLAVIPGDQALTALHAGELVRLRISRRSHLAHWLRIEN